MAKQRHIIAAVLALVALLIVLVSSAFLMEHADHDCTGADCLICEQLYVCAQNLRNFVAVGVTALTVAGFAAVSRTVRCGNAFADAPRTPVLLKVKLSN